MKTVIVTILLVLVVSLAFAGAQNNIWGKVFVLNGALDHDRVVYIEDKETGTRCYGLTNNDFNTSGYSIACVPKEK